MQQIPESNKQLNECELINTEAKPEKKSAEKANHMRSLHIKTAPTFKKEEVARQDINNKDKQWKEEKNNNNDRTMNKTMNQS